MWIALFPLCNHGMSYIDQNKRNTVITEYSASTYCLTDKILDKMEVYLISCRWVGGKSKQNE